MDSKQLSIIIGDGEIDLLETKNIIYNKYINKKENSSISSGFIAAIIIAIVVVRALIGLIIIFRKKIFKIKKETNNFNTRFNVNIFLALLLMHLFYYFTRYYYIKKINR